MMDDSVARVGTAPRRSGFSRLIGHEAATSVLLPLLVTAAMLAAGSVIAPSFASGANLWALLSTASMLGVVSAGQTVVIISGRQGIDLSVGPVITLAALVTAGTCAGSDAGLPLAIGAVAALCCIVGAVNFVGIYVVGIYPLIMTLGMAFVVTGGSLVYAQARGPSSAPPILLAVGGGRIGPVPWLVVVGAAVLIAATALVSRTRFGRRLFLTGANARAARLSGIPVARVYLTAYVVCSLLAGLTGVLVFGFAGSVNLSIGEPYTLMSIAAAVIGGTLLTGGRGSIHGAFLGAIVFVVLTNLLIVCGLGNPARQVLSGVVLIVILALTARETGLRV